MRALHTNFIRSNQMKYASDMAKNQSTIVKSIPAVEPQPEEPIVESQPESIIEEIKPIIEEPKIEQPKTISRLPNLGK
jgi:hypothetical protein